MTHNTSTLAAAPTSRFPRRVPGSTLTWLGVMALLAAISRVMTVFFPAAIVDPTQAMFFTWPALLVVGGIGLFGVWLAGRTGFPEPWAARIPNRRRLLLLLLIGALAGLLLAGFDRLTGFTQTLAARHGAAEQYTGFLPMLLTFTAAAVFVQVIYRLLFLPGLLWLTSNLLLGGRAQTQLFWALAVLTSALEPLTQWNDLRAVPGLVLAVRLAHMLGLNFIEAVAWRKYGWVAMILVRLGFYWVWHVLYVH